jgi:hypothetical protein
MSRISETTYYVIKPDSKYRQDFTSHVWQAEKIPTLFILDETFPDEKGRKMAWIRGNGYGVLSKYGNGRIRIAYKDLKAVRI